MTTIFTDHFSLKIQFTGIPRNKENKQPEARWNLVKGDGWKIYDEETNKTADKIIDIVEKECEDINEVMKKIEALETKVKFKSFGKTKPSVKRQMKAKKCGQACETLPCDNCKSQKQKDAETHARQTEKVESAIEETRRGRPR